MILRLGHAELFVTDLDKSRDFYVNVLGFIEAGKKGNSLYLRAIEEFDKYSLILTQNSYAGMGHFGLRVSHPDYLHVLKKLHDEQGIKNEFIEDRLHPGLGACLKVTEPNGHHIAFYHEMAQVDYTDGMGGMDALPMRRSHLHRGVPPLKIDHVNLRVPNVDEALKYWSSLDFSISEYVEEDEGKFAAWVRRTTTTHDVALVKAEKAALHHVAYNVDGVLGVVKTADLLADAGYRDSIEYGPGRHGVSNAFFLYIRDPDGHRIEIYSGDYHRDLDHAPIKWSKEDYDKKGRLWWGAAVPERFFETTPLNKEWMKVGFSIR
ncbi:3,4-dihydroxyphenylacetate 2,3-dioxygenase [Peribacillus sp. SCS-155]|uniref:3,4-dihydroxyphenylacetate 2,3-dioxygenase n=1 Tax=Peribacillus sedimenti TaxID=3115297 RepID=UPI003906924B